jgi:hypothetical protein
MLGEPGMCARTCLIPQYADCPAGKTDHAAGLAAESGYHAPMRHALKLHPDSRSSAVTGITVDVRRPSGSTVELHYVAQGDIRRVAIPPRAESKHVDELWKHTCFEVFLRDPAGVGYAEFNFSPSTEYAGYGFSRYREGMQAQQCTKPEVSFTGGDRRIELRASVWTARVDHINPEGPLRLGISAIIEETDGTKSYWALAHPQGKPDFHHIDGFALALAPEKT